MSNELNNEFEDNYKTIDNTRLFSVLSYISILWIVGLISDSDNCVVRFHINQGIVKTIIFGSAWFVLFVISKVLSAISIVLIPIVSLLWIIYFSIMLIYIILGIINAKNEIQKPLPIIGTLFHIL